MATYTLQLLFGLLAMLLAMLPQNPTMPPLDSPVRGNDITGTVIIGPAG